MNALMEDVAQLFRLTGQQGVGVTWIFTESHIKHEDFLEIVNSILMSGEVNNLFPKDELNLMVADLRSDMAKQRPDLVDNTDNLIQYFTERVRQNLHVILAFSPVGEDFRVRAMRFPALVNCTVIDWFHAWPVSALEKVARGNLKDIEFENDTIRDGVISFMPYSFDIVNKVAKKFKDQEQRVVHTTPKSFLELLSLYEGLLVSLFFM
jgi:dynein heavy chain